MEGDKKGVLNNGKHFFNPPLKNSLFTPPQLISLPILDMLPHPPPPPERPKFFYPNEQSKSKPRFCRVSAVLYSSRKEKKKKKTALLRELGYYHS